ncbi:MAG: peptide chain release factor N(5)-glutamine methyltransferase [Blastocatellia bacterium]
MSSIDQLLKSATESLKVAQIDDARRQASLLLMDLLNCNQAYLLAHNKDQIDDILVEKYKIAVMRRAQGEPLQYISGQQEFYGRDFIVTPDVLIPRPETELLVEFVLKLAKENKISNLDILDIGTGSGCIAVTLALELPNAKITAIDISPKALAIAQQNAAKHQVDSKITWVISDLVSNLRSDKQFYLCCANLPYINPEELETLAREVKDFEPHLALFAENQGQALIKRLIQEIVPFICKSGHLICEIGFGQEKDLLNIVNTDIWQIEETIKDLQSIPRIIVLRKK